MSLILGPWTIDIVETGRFGLDGGAMFGVVPKPLWEKAYSPADDRNRIPMVARCLLLRGLGRTILVDTGNAAHMPAKFQDIYAMDFSTSSLEHSLHQCGVAPSQITDVVFTHLHFDHAGGAVIPDGDDFAPRFTSARHYVQAEHLDWARNPTEKDRASFLPETWQCIVEAGMMEVLDGPGELFPDVHVKPLYGHTKAMQAVSIHADGHNVLFAADLFPTAAHLAIPYVMGYDNYPLTAIDEKNAILPRAVEERWILVFEHDALRQAATVCADSKGYRLDEEIVLTAEMKS
jgi:glyoxylase-like metal-dependent hydrolase (beta-lactamase superfamily II)